VDHRDHNPLWWTRSVQDHLGPRSDIFLMQGHHQPSSNNTSQYNKVPPYEKERHKREGACYYCGKIGHFSSDCYQKPRTQNHHKGYNQRGNGRRGGTERRGKPRRSYHTQEEINHTIEVTNTSNYVGLSGNENEALCHKR